MEIHVFEKHIVPEEVTYPTTTYKVSPLFNIPYVMSIDDIPVAIFDDKQLKIKGDAHAFVSYDGVYISDTHMVWNYENKFIVSYVSRLRTGGHECICVYILSLDDGYVFTTNYNTTFAFSMNDRSNVAINIKDSTQYIVFGVIFDIKKHQLGIFPSDTSKLIAHNIVSYGEYNDKCLFIDKHKNLYSDYFAKARINTEKHTVECYSEWIDKWY